MVEVNVREHKQLRRRQYLPDVRPQNFALQHVTVALGIVETEVGVACKRELWGQQSRRVGEGLVE